MKTVPGAAEIVGRQADELGRLLRSALFNEVDRRFAGLVCREDGGCSRYVGMAAALVSCRLREGHVFLDLAHPPAWEIPEEDLSLQWPALEEWREDLAKSPAVKSGCGMGPLLLTESGKLYLQRYWQYEKDLAEKLRELTCTSAEQLSADSVRRLDELFPDAEEQKQAARNALLRRFSLISGGPGTGKTTTVLKILMLLLGRDPKMVVRLAAPTGKAAARLQESVREGLANLACSDEAREQIRGQEASTIHRLLGSIPGSVFFRHNKENPLAADVVVLDEASMVDLPLMAKLLGALPAHCRLIILGDKDQLASVEAGSVLSGMVEASVENPADRQAPPLAGVATLLKKNYRFGNESGIFRVCNAVREGNAVVARAVFREETGSDVTWRELPVPQRLKEELRSRILAGYRGFLREKDPKAALAAFGRFQVLTALRKGPYGKENLNLLIEEILREDGLIVPGKRNYAGRPLMVTENDYSVRLFNGDVGVLLEDEEGVLMGYFRNEDGTIRKISPLRLPFTESAFAMTVHKSQGSEFDEVLTILPARDTRVLTRELVYTAISRARQKVELWSGEDVFAAAVSRKVARASGLGERMGKG